MRLADIVDERELIDQLDHARTLRLAKNELIWLAGNTFYGTKQIFEPAFMEWLAGFRLPDYELTRRDGQYELRFEGPWCETTMWEIPALAIINELRARAAMRGMSRFDLDVLYARAKAKLWSKVERLRALAARGAAAHLRFRHPPPPRLPVAALVRRGDAGGPRRHLHRHLQRQARDGHRPRGDRHQRPRTADGLRRARRRRRRRCATRPTTCCATGRSMYGGNLLVVLPDCFGTTSFLAPRARLGRGLEGRAPGFQIAARRRARTDRLVAARAAAIRATS